MSQVSTTEQLRIAVDTVSTEGVTHAMVVPTMLGRILDVLESAATTLPVAAPPLLRRRPHAARR